MESTSELRNYNKDLDVIHTMIRICDTSVEIINTIRNQYGLLGINERFFNYTQVINYRIVVIELNKLFASNPNNDHYQLLKWVNNLRVGNYSDIEKLPREMAGSIKKEIQEHNPSIKIVNDLRNKVFAHTDLNAKAVQSLDMSEISKLVTLSLKIYNEIDQFYFKTTTILNGPTQEGEQLAFLIELNEKRDHIFRAVEYMNEHYEESMLITSLTKNPIPNIP